MLPVLVYLVFGEIWSKKIITSSILEIIVYLSHCSLFLCSMFVVKENSLAQWKKKVKREWRQQTVPYTFELIHILKVFYYKTEMRWRKVHAFKIHRPLSILYVCIYVQACVYILMYTRIECI